MGKGRRSRAMFALFLVCLGCGLMTTGEAATRVVIRGQVIDTHIDAPQFPSSRDECTRFGDEIGELIKLVHEEHEACLADKGIPSGGGGSCTKRGCQNLHDAREELTAARSKGYAECNAAINERQRSERWGNSGYKTDLEEFTSALKSSPISAVRGLVKREINEVIDRVFGYSSPVLKGGLNAGMAANAMVSSFSALQRACKERSPAALNACNREMLMTIQNLPDMVPAKYSSDPGVSAIQNAMRTRLHFVLRDTMDQMDRVTENFDEATQERSSPSRRRRVTPLIENH